MIIVKKSQAILLDKNQLHTKLHSFGIFAHTTVFRVHSYICTCSSIGDIVNIWKSVWSEHPLLEQPSFVCWPRAIGEIHVLTTFYLFLPGWSYWRHCDNVSGWSHKVSVAMTMTAPLYICLPACYTHPHRGFLLACSKGWCTHHFLRHYVLTQETSAYECQVW